YQLHLSYTSQVAEPLTPARCIAAVCNPSRRQLEIHDTVLPGLSLRCTRNGHKSFCMIVRRSGKRVRLTIGNAALMSLADARNAAREALVGARLAKSTSVKSAPTFADLASL